MTADMHALTTHAAREGKYLTFVLGNEEYGIAILNVREIFGVMPITSVPQTPRFVKGVINLRGKVIPVVDLRLKFGMDEVEATPESCVIVVEIAEIIVGLVVDTVDEVVDVAEDEIEDAPSFGKTVNTSFISGMAKVKGEVKILLDMEKVLTDDEYSSISKLDASASESGVE